MRYDQGYGRHGGWEMRMEDGGHGYDGGFRDPGRRSRGGPAERPWVGGYRDGYQGGSGGYAVGTTGPLYADTRGYAGDFHERGYRRPRGARPVDGRGTVRLRGSARDLDPSFGRGEHGDTFAYNDEAGGTGFGGPGGARGGTGRGGRYDREHGGGYDRGMRGGGGSGDPREFQNEGRPEDYHPRYSPVGGTYAPMGGSYLAGPPPRPLRDPRWTSERTRWF
ncbi:MAG: hypothetical protein KY467_03275 [Gemmatimonadetes bacterium]|nr:hypothetical protein [Gemmatimonadota bacterium]